MSTNAEVIASFMEPIPKTEDYNTDDFSPDGWWEAVFQTEYCVGWTPCRLTLNECREVEARLTDEQWRDYLNAFPDDWIGYTQFWVHASAEQKIVALATMLREGEKQR